MHTPRRQSGAVRTLLTWYRPYLRGHRLLLTASLVATAVVLVCQGVIPLVVDTLLHHGEWDAGLLGVLIALILVQLTLGYGAHLWGHIVSIRSATALRVRIFDRTLVSSVVRQDGLARTSIVSRHTSDVDRVAEAFESTIVNGIPAVIRVIQSLVLLTFIEWRAGLMMAVATLGFLVLRTVIGRTMLVNDRYRLDLNSRVGERVDESITAHRLNAGLNLGRWQRLRFQRKADELEEATHRQGVQVTQLVTAAHAMGMVGLVLVVVFALVIGGVGLASVAAALLYVEAVVRGLEALPSWIRSVQLGVVSQHRIDQILTSPDRIDIPTQDAPLSPESGLALVDLTASLISGLRLTSASLALPSNVLIGLVTPTGSEPDAALMLLAGDENPDSGRVQLDGYDVRMPGIHDQLLYVSSESVSFNASVLDQLTAVDPTLDHATALPLLESVGLGHLATMPGGLDDPLGPMGARLTVNERQRLSLATALASRPRVLLVGSLMALADADTAMPLMSRIREEQCEVTVVSVRSPEVAESVDVMLFISSEGARLGSHQDLLVGYPEYARLWEQRLSISGVDLSVLGISESDQDNLQTRLVTERYAPGDVIYREGAEADRIIFTISGQVEISTTDAAGHQRRVAVLGPGNHCGDLRLTVGERRAESAYAIDDSVVRSLSREAISAGMMGLLDRTPTERRIVASILREGPATPEELNVRLADIDPGLIAGSLRLLTRDGALRDRDGQLSVVQKRTVKPGARDLLDRLGDL